jgi:hypothetical protein
MEVSGQLHAPAALFPGEQPPVPIVYEAGKAQEPVWRLWRREKFLVPAGNQTLAVQLVVRCYTDWAIPALGDIRAIHFPETSQMLLALLF